MLTTHPFPVGRAWWLAACTGIALTAGLVLLMVFAGVKDQEEYQVSVFSALLNAESLKAGSGPALWTNHFGFGTPLPLGHSFNLHPAFLLWPEAGLPVVMVVLWLGLAVGAVCLAAWLALLGVAPGVAAVAAASYVLGPAALAYMVANDWPSALFSWAIAPALFLAVAVLADRPAWRWPAALWLGVLGAMLLSSGHPGYVTVLLVPLAIYTLALLVHRPGMIIPLLVAGAIVVVVSIETVFYLLDELRYFPDTLPRESQGGYVLSDYLRSFARPFTAVGSFDPEAPLWQRYVQANENVRVPFLGIGFVIGCLIFAGALALRRHRLDAHSAGLVFALVVSLMLSLADPSTLGRAPSGMWLFRDCVTLTALALGSLGLTRLQAEPGHGTGAAAALLAIQLLQTVAVAVPPLYKAFDDSVESIFVETGQDPPTVRWLREAADTYGPRLIMAPAAERDMRMGFHEQGIYASADLVLAGLAPVNGWFKGTSQDVISPSLALMHGRIATTPGTIANARMLDAAGVTLVLSYESERDLLPPGLEFLGAAPAELVDPLVLFHNPQAWPRVAILPPGARSLAEDLPSRDGCPDPGLFCLAFEVLPDPMTPGAVDIVVTSDSLRATIPPGPPGRIAWISQLYRDHVVARIDGAPAKAFPLANGAFIGLALPETGGVIELGFENRIRVALWWLAAASLVTACAAAGVATLRVRALERRRGARA